MHQDSNFPYIPSEDPSDPPQLPFPEPGQPGVQGTPAIPMISIIPGTPTTQTGLDALQLPFPIEQPADSEYASLPFPQPLPSTETIDTAQIRFLQSSPGTERDERNVQLPFPQQSSRPEMDENAQIPQAPFPQPLNGIGPSSQNLAQQISPPTAQPYAPPFLAEANYQASMPGLIEIPVTTQAMPAQTTTTQEDSQQLAPSNQDAKRAIINGVISFIVSTFTFATVAGLAGLIIGTFAITYGLMGLRLAQRLPNKTGQGQAVIGIALGLIAWCIVIAAFILRAPQSS